MDSQVGRDILLSMKYKRKLALFLGDEDGDVEYCVAMNSQTIIRNIL